MDFAALLGYNDNRKRNDSDLSIQTRDTIADTDLRMQDIYQQINDL